jgi:hypothetical protein
MELAHLIALLGHLNFKALDLFLMLTNLHGELGSHALGQDI